MNAIVMGHLDIILFLKLKDLLTSSIKLYAEKDVKTFILCTQIIFKN